MHPRKAFCIFEYVYFSRPDSIIADRSVYGVRVNMGRELAKENRRRRRPRRAGAGQRQLRCTRLRA